MVDVVDTVPPAIDVEGNLVIWWVPTIANTAAPTAATELGGASAFRLTHSFTPGGFNFAGSQAKNTDERLALVDVLETLGKVSNTLALEYVDSTTASSAAVVLKPTSPATSKSGYFVVRPNVPIGTLAAAAQKVQVIPVTVGVQRKPITGTGKFLIQQEAVVTGSVIDATLAA